MKTLAFLIWFNIILLNCFAQSITLNGVVKDRITEKPIAGATVSFIDKNLSATTNENGFFKFTYNGETDINTRTLSPDFFEIYVPGKGIVFSNSKNGFASIEIVSLTGSIIDRLSISNLENGIWCYSPKLPIKGIYIFHLMLNGENRSLKFINFSDDFLGNVHKIKKINDNDIYAAENYLKSAKSYSKQHETYSSVNSLIASKNGYNNNSISWVEKNNDSITIFLLDTTAKDGVRPGIWKLTTRYGNIKIAVNSDGKTIDSLIYCFTPPCDDNNPVLYKDYGQALITSNGRTENNESIDLYFSDSLVTGFLATPDEVLSCSGAMVCKVSYCSITCDVFGFCTSVGYTWLPIIDSTLACKGSTSTDATLSNLVISPGILVPGFEPSNHLYSCTLSAGITSINIAPYASSMGETIKINNIQTTSGAFFSVNLFGSDTVKIEVTAIDGLTKITYNLLVNMPSQWYSIGLEEKPVTKLIAMPTNPTEIWAFDNDIFWGGLYLSTDEGKTWEMSIESVVGDKMPLFAVSPSNPNVAIMSDMWDGYTTTNKGEEWINIMPFPSGLDIFSFCFNPLNENVIYCGQSPAALMKSTNGGLDWKACDLDAMPANDIEIRHEDTSYVYIVSPNGVGDVYGGIYKSTDGGINWNLILNNSNLGDLTLDPVNNLVAYVSVIDSGIMKTTNGGETWDYVNNGLINLNVLCIAVDPINNNNVYAGTQNDGVYKSINGGTSWSNLNEGLSNKCVYSITVDKNNSSILYIGTDNGVFKFK